MTRPQQVHCVVGERFEEHRIRQGCLIDEDALQRCLANTGAEAVDTDTQTLFAESVIYDASTPEMMAVLSSGLSSLSSVAGSQGVSLRTFQRYLKRTAGQSATF